MMTVAPVVAAVVLWIVTRSPFVLMFALLGPVVAIAGVGDARRRAKSSSRKEKARFDRDVEVTRTALDIAHQNERQVLEVLYPSAVTIAEAPIHDPERWRLSLEDSVSVRIGIGTVESETLIEDVGETGLHSLEGRDVMATPWNTIASLRADAAVVTDAPIIVDCRWGIGAVGHRAGALSLVSSIVVQLAHLLAPNRVEMRANPAALRAMPWLTSLPHWSDSDTSQRFEYDEPKSPLLQFWPRGEGTPMTIALATDASALPHECRVVLQATGATLALIRHPTDQKSQLIRADFITEVQAREAARTLMLAAQRQSPRTGPTLPSRIEFRDLPHQQVRGRASLTACVGVDTKGPIILDLVADGPHALVGGTTGSGKSEFLLTWILAIAAAHGPQEVNFLLIDFKGGASFSAVKDLLHTVGILTDLDESSARRAILSLRAEVLRRERILAEKDAKSIVDLPSAFPLARLVVVVDEFATLASQLPELNELFADLAARGRSLGIHIVLCTQRPAGSVRDNVLANCALRISLRVHSATDSCAVVGVADAAQLPASARGRAILLRGGEAPEKIQIAISTAADAVAVSEPYHGHALSPHRPWLDPLPSVISPVPRTSVDRPGIPFGVVDLPEAQCRELAIYDPGSEGNLLVLGGHRSGKSNMLAVLAHDSVNTVRVPATIEGAWDSVTELLAEVRKGRGPKLVVFDDVDAVVCRFPSDYESAFLERLVALAREGPRAGTRLALSSASARGRLQVLETLGESTLLLRMPSRQDHVLAGGASSDFSADLKPGGGTWRGRHLQVFLLDSTAPTERNVRRNDHAEIVAIAPEPHPSRQQSSQFAVVSSRPSAIRDRLEQWGEVSLLGPAIGFSRESLDVTDEGGTPPTIFLGDAETWQAHWSLLATLRSRATVVFHDCPLSDFRLISRLRELPPPVDSPDATAVALSPDGRIFRLPLPEIAHHD